MLLCQLFIVIMINNNIDDDIALIVYVYSFIDIQNLTLTFRIMNFEVSMFKV